jgi:hypothetical protein
MRASKGVSSLSDLCVYNSDKDIVDHEVMNIRYENGAVAQFELCMFGAEETRTMTIFGTKATLQADFARSTVRVTPLKGTEESWVTASADGHGGGDRGLITELHRAQTQGIPLNYAREGFIATAMALAAEESMANDGGSVRHSFA